VLLRVLAVGLGTGVTFAILDGVLNANPVAQRLYAVYRPIARESVNAPLGLVVDLVSGIVMAAVFAALAPVLHGGPWTRGLAFGLLVWYFRVAMNVAGQAVMFNIPAPALLYSLASGLVEMALLGLLLGFALRPAS
jgi:hypothetical protein